MRPNDDFFEYNKIDKTSDRIPIRPLIRKILSLSAGIALGWGCGPAPVPPPPIKPGPPAKESPKELRVVPERVEGKKWLTPDAAKATAAGAGPLRMIGADIGSEGDRIASFIEIPERECALVMARSSPSVADVDLFAYEDDGSTFASDEAVESAATLLICPPHPARLYAVARVMSGSGFLSVGVQSVKPEQADAVAQATGARGRPGQDSGRLDSWPGLEAKIRAHRSHLGARWEEVRRVALPVGSRAPSRVSLSAEAGRCLDVLIVPSNEVAMLEAVAEDAGGRIVTRAREQGNERWFVLCAADAAEFSLSVRPRSSEGLVAVVIARSAVGAQAEIEQGTMVDLASQPMDLQRARQWFSGRVAGKGDYGPAHLSGTGAARAGSRSTMTVELPAGCSRVDVIAGAPLVDVMAELWNDKNALWASGRGGAVASLFACGAGGPARVDVEAMGRPGPFALEVRKDTNKKPAAALLSLPVAAGRLLSRMSAGGGRADTQAAEKAISVGLDDASLKRIPLLAAPNTCVEVIAALDAEASGVELRIVDAKAQEVSLSRARHVTADRLCAGSGPAVGFAELRLRAGKGNALVLVR